jgi:hypothetical protein
VAAVKARERMSMEFTRLRAWLKYIRDNEPVRLKAFVNLALNTKRWPDEFRACASCGYPTSKDLLICEYCKMREEDHRDEVRERHSVGHFM